MIKTNLFGIMPDSKKEIIKFTVSNNNGMEVSFINFGAIITSIVVPDKNGNPGDIVLGFDKFEKYLTNPPYFGAVIGRVANRISKGSFILNGKKINVTQNGDGFQLHGGEKGFDKKYWEAVPFEREGLQGVKFSYLSKDGEEGYPGNLHVTVKYLLTGNNELIIEYQASSDNDTVINLTNHTYFNLKGEGKEEVYNHILKINSDKYLLLSKETLVPTGDIVSVHNTAYDFTIPQTIGKRIDTIPPGYDICYVLDGDKNSGTPIAEVFEPTTGRFLQAFTNQPAFQLYTGNYLEGIKGKNNHEYINHSAFCIETQDFPDAPNHPAFPSILLKKGEIYHRTTKFKFGIKN
jgi:aldose 1-epimerase